MKRFVPHVILCLFLLIACAAGLYWWQVGRHLETTDNAYIRGEITPISAKISGYVTEVLVADHQAVAAGQPLLQIEKLEYRVRLQRGKSCLAERQAALQVTTERKQQQASKIALAEAQMQVAEVEHTRASEEFSRFAKLYEEGIISPLEYGKVQAASKRSEAEQRAAAAALAMARQELTVLTAEEQQLAAEIEQQRETVKLLEQELSDTLVRAPIDGTLGNRRVRVGQYVRPGSVLMALIPLQQVWVEANFKEVQLERMQVGQPVEIAVDAFPGRTFSGRIASLSPASGAEFSLLPPENASGNFTKIVQRIPVRISLEQNGRQNILRPGMSVEVRLDTRRSGDEPGRKQHVASVVER